MNFKKVALSSLSLASLVIGANAFAAVDPVATAVWSGTVPASTAGASLIITGTGGDVSEAAYNKGLSARMDGTFDAIATRLEARAYDDTTETPTIGDMVQSTWTVTQAEVTYGGVKQLDQNVIVKVDGTELELNSPVMGKEFISLGVAQDVALANDVGGMLVQASVTVMASADA